MSILIQEAPSVTKEDLLKAKVAYIKRVAAVAYKRFLEAQTNGIDMMWHDPKFTPQEIATALGKDAAKIFQVHGILTECIKDIAAVDGITPEIKLPTNAFEIVNGDIIISPHPYTP